MSHGSIRKWLFAFGVLAVIAASGRAANSATPLPARDLVYKRIGEVELKVHIFPPAYAEAGATYPALVLFFGGGWKNGAPSQLYPQAAYFASRGMLVLCADYRTESKNHVDPRVCVQDAKSCLRWVRAHAGELQIDPQRLAAGGASAGGHLAAAAAALPGLDAPDDDLKVSCRPDALVLFNPVINNGPGDYGYERVKDYYREFSPAHNLHAGLPPMLLMFGTKDEFVPVKTAESFQTEMQRLGNRCDLKFYPGQPHGFFNYKDGHNPFYQQTVDDADAFLVSLKFLPPRSTSG